MALIELNTRPNPKQVRTFGVIGLPVSLAALASIAWLRFDSLEAAGGLVIAALVVAALARIAPSLIRVLMVGFNVVTYPLSWVVSHLALAILYFGVLTPLGWIVRAIHGDPLARTRDDRLASYWMARRATSLERYFRQY